MFNIISQNRKIAGEFKRIYLTQSENKLWGNIYTYDPETLEYISLGDYDYNRAKEIFNELIRFAEEGFTYDTLDNGVRTTKSKFYRLPRYNK